MAIASPEGRETSLLTETEQAALEQESTLQTARAVTALADITSELGGDDSLTPMAESMRDRMAMMSLREQRKFRRSLEQAGRLLVETSIAGFGDVLPFHDVHEVTASEAEKPASEAVAADPSPADVTEPALPEDEIDETAPETTDAGSETETVAELTDSEQADDQNDDENSQQGESAFNAKARVDFLTKVNKLTVPGGLVDIDTNDDDMLRAIISLYPNESHKPKLAITSASRLTMILEGRTFEEIAEAEAQEGNELKRGAYDQFKLKGAPAFVAKHLSRLTAEATEVAEEPTAESEAPQADPKEERRQAELAAYVEKVVAEAPPLRRASDLAEQPVELASGIRMIEPQAVRPERPLEEEPDFVQIAERLTGIINWDGTYRTAFRAHLDPTNRTSVITRSKAEACEMFITALKDCGLKSLEGPELNLRRDEAIQIYRLVGIRYTNERAKQLALISVGRDDLISVYEQIDATKRNGRTPKETERSIFKGLRKIVEYLEAHHTAAVS